MVPLDGAGASELSCFDGRKFEWYVKSKDRGQLDLFASPWGPGVPQWSLANLGINPQALIDSAANLRITEWSPTEHSFQLDESTCVIKIRADGADKFQEFEVAFAGGPRVHVWFLRYPADSNDFVPRLVIGRKQVVTPTRTGLPTLFCMQISKIALGINPPPHTFTVGVL